MMRSLIVLGSSVAACSAVELHGAVAASMADTPVTRVVNLLKEMQNTLNTDLEEDEALFKKLSCWCNDGRYEKTEAIKASTAKISELQSTIEGSAAKVAELKTQIAELESRLADDKQALGEATALREKQLSEFHGMETDSIQALENLKAAVTVLSKHQDNAPESTVAGGAVFKSERDSWSFLELASRSFPWAASHEEPSARAFDDFMRHDGFDEDSTAQHASRKPVAPQRFLRTASALQTEGAAQALSVTDSSIVQRAVKSVAAFAQAHHKSMYVPAYTSQSGEIFGVLKQMEEEMQADLKEAQSIEQERASAFAELRAAKTEQIKADDKMAEKKEDELANMDNALAEAKEDLEKEQNVLAEDQEFLKNLNEMCSKGSADFDERKAARLEEMKAVAETISILQGDEARDAMTGTFSFVQLAAAQLGSGRQRAAVLLRRAGRRIGSTELSALATSVELDAFTKVKAAIDEMSKMLKTQQADEVKKNDWCKDELDDNDMNTAKEQDHNEDLQAQIAQLEQTVKTLTAEIDAAKAQIEQTQLDLQRATEDRQQENHEFQKTIADQTMTIAVLKKALDRLATFYDFQQTAARGMQTPPMPQKEYKANAGATGVMEMIEKLVFDAKGLMKDSRKSESTAQAGYEQLIADTNNSVKALSQEVTSKTQAKADAAKDKLEAESSLADSNGELEGLAKYKADLHKECDYLLKNFDLRQQKRGDEMESLEQAKQILNGASFD